ncbi:uncharacterized protein BDR25DRAFT_303191, partial [Lindgomyces ingoldianus]
KTANYCSITYYLLMLSIFILEVIICSRVSRSTVLTLADWEALFNKLVAHGWMY